MRSRLKLGRKVGTVHDDAKTPILQQVTEIIVLEIQKTFDFFRASAAGEHIEKIYLAGGSAKVPGLVEALAPGVLDAGRIVQPVSESPGSGRRRRGGVGRTERWPVGSGGGFGPEEL